MSRQPDICVTPPSPGLGGSSTVEVLMGDNTREVSMDEVVEAAKKANIHSFVASLPQVWIWKLFFGAGKWKENTKLSCARMAMLMRL